MPYLFIAYLVIWLFLAGYIFSMQKKQKRLFAEIEKLKRQIPAE